MLTWKTLHVLAMFLTVLFFDGPTLAFWWAARKRDVVMLRGVNAMVKRTDLLGVASVLAGVGFGVATGLTGGFDFSAGWLVTSYVLLGSIIVIGGVLFPMWYARVERAAEESPDHEASPELLALLRDPRTIALAIVPLLLFFTIIYLMVAKPL